ncbi:S-layer homology domain-containing protein [Pseudomonadota bacterium]
MKKFTWLIAGLLMGIAITASASTVYYAGYPDVSDDAYYYGSVRNMSQLGIIQGYDNGNFGPEDPVTRGQTATIMDRYHEINFDAHRHMNESMPGTVGELYGLEYVCPEETSVQCYESDISGDAWFCGYQDYIDWAKENCGLTVIP